MRSCVFLLQVKEPFSHLSAVTAFHCETKCRFPLQAAFVVQSVCSSFGLLSIYRSSYSDGTFQESAFLLLAIYDTHLDQLIIIGNFQYFCSFCFKWKCVFPVFLKQVFFQLLFFLYLDFYPIVDVTDSCSCFILMLMMSEPKLTAHPGASPCLGAHALLPSHILKVFSALFFIPPSCSVASVIISLGSSFKTKNIKITLANQCSSSVVLLILLFPP